MDEDENTLSLLNRYIDESEFDLDKNIIKGIFQDLYRQAFEVRVMFLLTLHDKKEEGAYAVQDHQGDKVLFLFEEEDDATRYAMQLNEDEHQIKRMDVIEVDDSLH